MLDVQVLDVQMLDVQMLDVQMLDVQVLDIQMIDVQMLDVQMLDVQVYKSTERISLVSSFAASLFVGKVSRKCLEKCEDSLFKGGGDRLVRRRRDEPAGHPDQGVERRPPVCSWGQSRGEAWRAC